MTTIIDLAQKLESFIEIPVAITVAEGGTKLQQAQVHFALITENNNPQALVTEANLTSLIKEQNLSLASVLKQLPSLVVVDRASTILDAEDLKLLSRYLKRTKANGLVVYQNDTLIGVV